MHCPSPGTQQSKSSQSQPQQTVLKPQQIQTFFFRNQWNCTRGSDEPCPATSGGSALWYGVPHMNPMANRLPGHTAPTLRVWPVCPTAPLPPLPPAPPQEGNTFACAASHG
mmetsp:Transcript_40010/g.64967  ORF Transcript_40010/g.64967 Transcript_40010/m.64967 type:complete len:111 (+) Transcript_40010:290-622(+)